MTYNTEGIILHYRDVGEFDRIYTVLSAEHGEIDGWAQGIRKPKSKLVAHLQPLYFCDFMFARGRRFDRIAQVRVLNRFPALWSDLEKMARAMYAASLVDQVLRPGTKERGVFGLLMDVLNIMHNAPPPPLNLRGEDAIDDILTIFSLKLLRKTGFSPELHFCVLCKKEVEGLSRLFDAVRGGVLCSACFINASVEAFPVSSITLETLETGLVSPLARLEMPDAISRELARISSAMMSAHFGDPPKAWSFIEGLAREPLYAGAIA